MRIVVRSALLLALMVGLPSAALAQSRYHSDRPAYGTQKHGNGVVSTGTYSGRSAKWPKGWVQQNDRDDRYPDPGASAPLSQDQDGNTASSVEGDGNGTYRESDGDTAATVEGGTDGDYRYGDTADTVENDGGSDDRYGGAAGTVENEGDGDYRYGQATGTFQDFGGNSYSGRSGSSYSGRYGSAARTGRSRVTNCYIDRRGRTICR
jgi:hypothetical protein